MLTGDAGSAARRAVGPVAALGRGGVASVLAVAVLGLGVTNASAGAFGPASPSTGLTATLLAVFAMKGWPSGVTGAGFSTAGGALLVAAVLAWWFPLRTGALGTTLRMRVGGGVRGRFRSRLASSPSGAVTAGVDSDGAFVDLFVRVHAAWDRSEWETLRACTTESLLAELIDERAAAPGERTVRATVFTAIEAEVVDLDRLAGTEVASVAFSGMLREQGAPDATPFRELWLVTRVVETAGTDGWRLARQLTLY